MLFVGGPCTSGPGCIVGTSLEETIRANVDIEHDKAPYLKEAQKFYERVAERCRKNHQTVDLFACCLDQVGLLEMRSCIETTGGLCLLGDFFSQSVFGSSLSHVFQVYPDEYREGGGRFVGGVRSRRGVADDGIRRDDRAADDEGVQGERVHRSVHVAEEGGSLRGRAGDRRGTRAVSALVNDRAARTRGIWVASTPLRRWRSTSKCATARSRPSRIAVAACSW